MCTSHGDIYLLYININIKQVQSCLKCLLSQRFLWEAVEGNHHLCFGFSFLPTVQPGWLNSFAWAAVSSYSSVRKIQTANKPVPMHHLFVIPLRWTHSIYMLHQFQCGFKHLWFPVHSSAKLINLPPIPSGVSQGGDGAYPTVKST